MTKKISYIILGILCLYFVLVGITYNSKSSGYNLSFNNTRKKIGLKPLTKSWNIESIDTTFSENVYCENWTNEINDTSIPYHKSKRIVYKKDFWTLKNKIQLEVDEFIKPIPEIGVITLETVYDFKEKIWKKRIDTLKNIRSFCANGRRSSLKNKYDTKIEIEETLKNWNLK